MALGCKAQSWRRMAMDINVSQHC